MCTRYNPWNHWNTWTTCIRRRTNTLVTHWFHTVGHTVGHTDRPKDRDTDRPMDLSKGSIHLFYKSFYLNNRQTGTLWFVFFLLDFRMNHGHSVLSK
jgi:hypothetical protein